MHSPSVSFCLTFSSFWLCLIAFVPVICLNNVFLRKAMAGVALNTFPNVLLIFNICQCLVIISLIFCKVELYVTENGITLFCTALVLFCFLQIVYFFDLISSDECFLNLLIINLKRHSLVCLFFKEKKFKPLKLPKNIGEEEVWPIDTQVKILNFHRFCS